MSITFLIICTALSALDKTVLSKFGHTQMKTLLNTDVMWVACLVFVLAAINLENADYKLEIHVHRKTICRILLLCFYGQMSETDFFSTMGQHFFQILWDHFSVLK